MTLYTGYLPLLDIRIATILKEDITQMSKLSAIKYLFDLIALCHQDQHLNYPIQHTIS
jgi:hypothetical protein